MKKIDLFIILGVVLIAGSIYGWNYYKTHTTQYSEKYVEIYQDGNLYDSVNILDNKEIHVDTDLGHNVILVNHGKVQMLDSDCPDKICVNTGTIDQVGQSIVCLPNKVYVVIAGTSEDGIDAIVQ